MLTLVILTMLIALMFYATVYDVILYLPDPPNVQSWTWIKPSQSDWMPTPPPKHHGNDSTQIVSAPMAVTAFLTGIAERSVQRNIVDEAGAMDEEGPRSRAIEPAGSRRFMKGRRRKRPLLATSDALPEGPG